MGKFFVMSIKGMFIKEDSHLHAGKVLEKAEAIGTSVLT